MIVFNGSTGGIGRYLSQELLNRQVPYATLVARLSDTSSLRQQLDQTVRNHPTHSPITLIQVAAMVSVPKCEEDPTAAWRTNVSDTAATVEAFAHWALSGGYEPRVIYLSSGHVYAPKPKGSLTTESDSVDPRSVYAKTKLAAEEQLHLAAEHISFPLVVARVFGLIAPNQSSQYMLPSLIQRARTLSLEKVPGLSYSRDYLDARDVCRHLWFLTRHLDDSRHMSTITVNVCSGAATTIREVLDEILLQIHGSTHTSGFTHAMERITEGPGRSTDLRWLVGDPARLMSLTGQPARTISLSQTVEDALVYER